MREPLPACRQAVAICWQRLLAALLLALLLGLSRPLLALLVERLTLVLLPPCPAAWAA